MDLETKLKKIYTSGYSIIIQDVAKRINGEWTNKIVWEHVQEGNKTVEFCKWDGFDDIDDCADDCLKYIESLKKWDTK
jgi:hypothetical protein